MIKKIIKILLKIIGVFFLLVVIVLTACLRRIDYRPFQEKDYYNATVKQLNEIVEDLPELVSDTLYAGSGKAGLTPPVGLPLAGFGNRKGKPSTGVHDSLYIRVIALQSGEQQAYIVGYDALMLHPPVARLFESKVQKELNIQPEKFLYTATHSHSGPGGWGKGFVEEQFAGPFDSTIVNLLVDSTIIAVKRAIQNVKPASFKIDSVRAPRFIRNRLVGDKGEIDDELIFTSLMHENNLDAMFATFSAHATVMGGKNMLFSGDYPGYFERKIESTLDCQCLFAAAGLGSHSYRGEGDGFDKAAFVGEGLADSVLSNLNNNNFKSLAVLQVFRVPVAAPRMQIRITQDICLAPWLAKRLLKPYDSYIQFLVIDDFIIIGSPGEFSGELALEVKRYARKLGKAVTITSFNGCYMGYVTPSEYYEMDSYETKTMSWFGPYTGDYLVDLMKQVIERI